MKRHVRHKEGFVLNVNLIGKKGLLVGGEMHAFGNVNAVTAGSNMGTVTIVELGIDQQMKKEWPITEMEH